MVSVEREPALEAIAKQVREAEVDVMNLFEFAPELTWTMQELQIHCEDASGTIVSLAVWGMVNDGRLVLRRDLSIGLGS